MGQLLCNFFLTLLKDFIDTVREFLKVIKDKKKMVYKLY